MSVQRLAVLIDGDNIGPSYASTIVDFASHLSEQCSYLVFGGPKPNCQSWWAAALEECLVDDLRVLRNLRGKNAADLRLTAAGVELYFQRATDGYLLVTHDSDLLPLVRRLQELHQPVFGCATAHVSRRLRLAVDAFFELPQPIEAAHEDSTTSVTSSDSKIADEVRRFLVGCLRNFGDTGTWVHLDVLGAYLGRQSAAYKKDRFGHRSLGKLLEQHGFEVADKKGRAKTRVPACTEAPPPDEDEQPLDGAVSMRQLMLYDI